MIMREQRQLRRGVWHTGVKQLARLGWLAALLVPASCSDYLDVVPDNTLKLENIYATKDDAYDALAKIYSYLPNDPNTHESMWELGDEFIGRIDPA